MSGNNPQGYGLHQGVELLLPLGWSRKALGTLISGGTGNAGEQLDSMSFRCFSSVNDSVILSFCWAKSPVWVMGRGAAVSVTGLSASGWGDELWGRGPALHLAVAVQGSWDVCCLLTGLVSEFCRVQCVCSGASV